MANHEVCLRAFSIPDSRNQSGMLFFFLCLSGEQEVLAVAGLMLLDC